MFAALTKQDEQAYDRRAVKLLTRLTPILFACLTHFAPLGASSQRRPHREWQCRENGPDCCAHRAPAEQQFTA